MKGTAQLRLAQLVAWDRLWRELLAAPGQEVAKPLTTHTDAAKVTELRPEATRPNLDAIPAELRARQIALREADR